MGSAKPVASALDGGHSVHAAPWVGSLTWAIGPAFLALTIWVWNRGVLHYTSTGS
jgi:hypothetical protein